MKIVIVDDSTTSLRLLRARVEAQGHTTFGAANGIDALEILTREDVDAVVTDIVMPGMDGYLLCHEIRTNDRLRDLPIIIYSASSTSPTDEKLALDLGADKYVNKAASIETILAALNEVLALDRSARPAAVSRGQALKEYNQRIVTNLERKNSELDERLRLNALSLDVGAALMHGHTLTEILQRCSEALVQHLGAAFARIWTHNEREQVLELKASAGLYVHIDGPHGRVPVGQFKIGRIAADRKPHLTNSVIGDPRVPEQEWARREGLVAFAGYPLIIGDRLLGVLAMFAREPLSQGTLDKIASIADAVALGIERKRAEHELRSAHDQLRRLLASCPAMMYNVRIEGENLIPTFVSENIQRILGFPAAECMSYGWWFKSLHPDDRERSVASLTAALKTGGHTTEYRIQHLDGTYRWFLDSNVVAYDAGGEPLELAGVWTDISDFKAEENLNRRLEATAAEAEAANRAKSVFLSTMSHEIRTPMNAILGYTQLMLRDPGLGEETKANLKIIGRSGEYLLTLINDVLDMSKIEAGRTELSPATFNVSKLLEDLAQMFRLRAEAKALRFEMRVDGESVPDVVADEGKIRQVLINLLGNAIKFTDRGHVRLHVTVARRSNVLWLSAAIEDTGWGITEEDQRKLFEPFSQAKRTHNIQEGTGLGLAISRKFARLMGGDVTVTSDSGRGSIFRLEIPIECGDAGAAIGRSAPRHVIGLLPGTTVPRILVVDDRPESQDWLLKLLTSVGFSVRGADNGEAAVRSWREWSPRLILMDVHMPVMDGLEATRRIKTDPRGKGTVIVALTASALDEDRRAVFQSGADDFLAKPCQEHELLEKMRVRLNITYEYEQREEAESGPLFAVAALNIDKLGHVPPALIGELRHATLRGDKEGLDALILKVHETEDAGFARALHELADKYDYDALTRLLEDVCRSASTPSL